MNILGCIWRLKATVSKVNPPVSPYQGMKPYHPASILSAAVLTFVISNATLSPGSILWPGSHQPPEMTKTWFIKNISDHILLVSHMTIYPNGHHSLHFDEKPRCLISENIVIVNYLPAVKSLIKLNKCLSLPSLGSCINEISFQNKKSVLKYIHLGTL